MSASHQILTNIILAHTSEEPLKLADKLREAKQELLIDGFNFFELGPTLRGIDFSGVTIKNSSFEAMMVSECDFSNSTCEQNNYVNTEFSSSTRPNDYHPSDKKVEASYPTPWETLMLQDKYRKNFFDFTKLPHYATTTDQKAVCTVHESGAFYNLENPKYADSDTFSHKGCKLHLRIEPSQIKAALELIGQEVFDLGLFKVLNLEVYQESLIKLEKREAKLDASDAKRDPDAKVAFDNIQKLVLRTPAITQYLRENEAEVPEYDDATLKKRLRSIANKLRAETIRPGQKLDSDAELSDPDLAEYFSFRIDIDLAKKYHAAKMVGNNYNPANLKHSYGGLLKPTPKPSGGLFSKKSDLQICKLDARKHFSTLPQSADTFKNTVSLTLQACIGEFLTSNKFEIQSPEETKEEDEKKESKDNLLRLYPLSRSYVTDACHHSFEQQLTLLLLCCFYLSNEKNRYPSLMSFDAVECPAFIKLAELFEQTRRQVFRLTHVKLTDIPQMIKTLGSMCFDLISEKEPDINQMKAIVFELLRIFLAIQLLPAPHARHEHELHDEIHAQITAFDSEYGSLLLQIDPLELQYHAFYSQLPSLMLSTLQKKSDRPSDEDKMDINSGVLHYLVEYIQHTLPYSPFNPLDIESPHGKKVIERIENIIKVINKKTPYGQKALKEIVEHLDQALRVHPKMYLKFMEQIAKKDNPEAHHVLAKFYEVVDKNAAGHFDHERDKPLKEFAAKMQKAKKAQGYRDNAIKFFMLRGGKRAVPSELQTFVNPAGSKGDHKM